MQNQKRINKILSYETIGERPSKKLVEFLMKYTNTISDLEKAYNKSEYSESQAKKARLGRVNVDDANRLLYEKILNVALKNADKSFENGIIQSYELENRDNPELPKLIGGKWVFKGKTLNELSRDDKRFVVRFLKAGDIEINEPETVE
ncbi:hypothetical protein AAU57_12155 [Nonlabens sp. YIK11]|uniref:hypothetical protein n=1 Tax=Nonlabens sp. YIK11 TaxID=1453349 RepID=UPI0006DC00A7|nr:hypothetical protein [Nonlabens sp. YIK11]KQC33999.1 hypothetical protein AAU57_12155 [Nonlabens sp. YIK11]